MEDINELLDQWRELKVVLEEHDSQIADMRKELGDLEARIKTSVIALGESCSHNGVVATYRRGYERVNWDGKALEGFTAAHPEILPFRSSSFIKPSVSIKLR